MKIGFLISVVGIFGSVREVIENANVLHQDGHEVFIFNPERETIQWIESYATPVFESKLKDYQLDILFLCTEPTNHYLELFKTAKADKKVFVMMGFDQNKDFLTGYANLNYILDNYFVTADGSWQLEWFKKNTKSDKILNNQFGGINLSMFSPIEKTKRAPVVGWSGDPRERKGGKLLQEKFEKMGIETKTYWKRGLSQNMFRFWFSDIDIFVDNHNRGGWCNPVAESMACKTTVLCSDTPCNSDFAIDNVTCLKFECNNMESMESKLIDLINKQCLCDELSENGLQKIRQFDYNIITRKLIKEIESR